MRQILIPSMLLLTAALMLCLFSIAAIQKLTQRPVIRVPHLEPRFLKNQLQVALGNPTASEPEFESFLMTEKHDPEKEV
jgi:hypothetical protein